MLHVRKTTGSVANLDLEGYQAKRATAAANSAISLMMRPHNDGHLSATYGMTHEELAAASERKFIESQGSKRVKQVQTFLSRPNSAFTSQMKRELIDRVSREAVHAGTSGSPVSPAVRGSSTPGYGQSQSTPDLNSLSPSDAPLQDTRQLTAQPAQLGTAKYRESLIRTREVELRIRNLESAQRKSRAIQHGPAAAASSSSAASSAAASAAGSAASAAPSSAAATAKAGRPGTTNAGRPGTTGPGTRLALRDYLIDIDGSQASAAARVAAGERWGGAAMPNNSGDRTADGVGAHNGTVDLFDGLGDSQHMDNSGMDGGGGVPVLVLPRASSSASRAGSRGSSSRSGESQESPLASPASAWSPTADAAADAAAFGSSNNHASNNSPSHARDRCASPQQWPRPWREPGARGKFEFQHQVQPGRAYDCFGDYNEWSHSFRDRQPEKELGAARISTTSKTDPRRAFRRPGELDVAATTVVMTENESRRYREHPFLFKNNRVVAPGELHGPWVPNLSNGDLDVYPRPGEAERKARALGDPYISVPKHSDVLRTDRPWSAWRTSVRPSDGSWEVMDMGSHRLPPTSPMKSELLKNKEAWKADSRAKALQRSISRGLSPRQGNGTSKDASSTPPGTGDGSQLQQQSSSTAAAGASSSSAPSRAQSRGMRAATPLGTKTMTGTAHISGTAKSGFLNVNVDSVSAASAAAPTLALVSPMGSGGDSGGTGAGIGGDHGGLGFGHGQSPSSIRRCASPAGDRPFTSHSSFLSGSSSASSPLYAGMSKRMGAMQQQNNDPRSRTVTREQFIHSQRLRTARGPAQAAVLPVGYGDAHDEHNTRTAGSGISGHADDSVAAGSSRVNSRSGGGGVGTIPASTGIASNKAVAPNNQRGVRKGAFNINVAEYARTGIDPLQIAVSARDERVTMKLGLNDDARHQTHHYYADPIRHSAFSQSPYRHAAAYTNAIEQSMGLETNPARARAIGRANAPGETLASLANTAGPGVMTSSFGSLPDKIAKEREEVKLATALHLAPPSSVNHHFNHQQQLKSGNSSDQRFVSYKHAGKGWGYEKVVA